MSKKRISWLVGLVVGAVVGGVALVLGIKIWIGQPQHGKSSDKISQRSKEFIQSNKDNSNLELPVYLSNSSESLAESEDQKYSLVETKCFNLTLPLQTKYLRIEDNVGKDGVSDKPVGSESSSGNTCRVKALATNPRAQLSIYWQDTLETPNLNENTGVTLRQKDPQYQELKLNFGEENKLGGGAAEKVMTGVAGTVAGATTTADPEYQAFSSPTEVIIFVAGEKNLLTVALYDAASMNDELKNQAQEIVKLIVKAGG
jgi:hypothetical protein